MKLAEDDYKRSVHYNPPSGGRADCGHCHVSQGIFAATWDHVKGTKDLIKQVKGKLVGPDYDDPVINALHAPEVAFAARAQFRANGSKNCMRCHVIEAITGKRPDTLAIHTVDAKGKSCIECHINLVHRRVPDEKTFKRDAWNRMVEEEFGLAPGTAEKLLAQ